MSAPTLTALLVLGRYAYAVVDGEMVPLAGINDGLTPQQALEGWLENDTPKVRAAIPIVWEPHGDHAILHDRIEVPRISRSEFAAADDVLRKFPALALGTHGWGFEPLQKGIITGRVFVHIESVPGVQLFGETVVSQGLPVAAVWTLPTIAFNGFGRGIGNKVLALAPGFCGVFTVPANGGTTKGMVSVVDTTHKEAGRALFPALQQQGFFESEQAPKGWRIVGTKQDLLALGPILVAGVKDESIARFIENVAQTVPIKSWPEFISETVKKLPRGGEQDLWATFPQPFPLGKVVRVLTIAAAITAGVFGYLARSTSKQAQEEKTSHGAIATSVHAQLDKAQADQAIVAKYKSEAGKDPMLAATAARGRAALLQALHDKVIENYTLTSLVVGADGSITAEFFQVVDGPDSPQDITNLRNELQRAGFSGCNIQAISTVADRENGPGLATKHRYQLTAQYTPPA